MPDLIARLPDEFNEFPLFAFEKNVEFAGDKAIFKGNWTESDASKLLVKGMPPELKRSFRSAKPKSLHGNSAAYARLREILPDAKDVEKFYVAEIKAANTREDYERDVIGKSVLVEMADIVHRNKQIQFLFDHDDSKILGGVFMGRVEDDPENPGHSTLIETIFAAPEATYHGQPGMSVERAASTGYLKFVSVRFGADYEFSEGKDGYPVRIFKHNPSARETMHTETSAVYFGAQRDATLKGIKFSEHQRKSFPTKTIDMDFSKDITVKGVTLTVTGTIEDSAVKSLKIAGVEKAIEDAQAKAAALETERDTLQKQIDELKEPFVQKALKFQNDENCKIAKALHRSEDELKGMDLDKIREYAESLEKSYSTDPFTKVPDGKPEEKETETYQW